MKTLELSTIHCPELDREISHGDCYETRMGISNILSEVGIDDNNSIRTCKHCEARKPKPTLNT